MLNFLLHVEDDDAASFLLQLALNELGLPMKMHRVDDGEEALAFLRREGKYAGSPRPDLVILDLNLPRKGGLQTLSEIRDTPELRNLPVVILASASLPKERATALGLGALDYITKPSTFDGFVGAVKQACAACE